LAGQDGSLGGDPGCVAGVVGSDQSVVRGLAAEQVVHVVTYLKFKIGLFELMIFSTMITMIGSK